MIDWDDGRGALRNALGAARGPGTAGARATRLSCAARALLDVGCGNGDFCALALARGADVSGVDAAEAMIASARERAPAADLRVAGMDALPYEDGAFDIVTGFNSLQFSDDPPASLREWMRVTGPAERSRSAPGPSASAARSTWSKPRCASSAARRPASRSGRGWRRWRAPRVWTCAPSDEVAVPYEVADQEELEVAFLLDARGYGAIEAVGERGSRAAITAAAAPFRRDDGSYRFENVFRYVIGTV